MTLYRSIIETPPTIVALGQIIQRSICACSKCISTWPKIIPSDWSHCCSQLITLLFPFIRPELPFFLFSFRFSSLQLCQCSFCCPSTRYVEFLPPSLEHLLAYFPVLHISLDIELTPTLFTSLHLYLFCIFFKLQVLFLLSFNWLLSVRWKSRHAKLKMSYSWS